jgi:lysosomal acid lipase/cholesteryl ester hydrolase
MMIPGTRLMQQLCSPRLFAFFVKQILATTFAWSSKNISSDNLIKYYQHVYSSSSVKIIVHWFQMLNAGGLCMFQPAAKGLFSKLNCIPNRKCLYYDVSIITAPVGVIAGGSDTLIAPLAAQEAIPNCVGTRIIPEFEHLEVIWADTFKETVFPHIMNFLVDAESDD